MTKAKCYDCIHQPVCKFERNKNIYESIPMNTNVYTPLPYPFTMFGCKLYISKRGVGQSITTGGGPW